MVISSSFCKTFGRVYGFRIYDSADFQIWNMHPETSSSRKSYLKARVIEDGHWVKAGAKLNLCSTHKAV
jgi:hypothetical protein